jgi:hypothetical protein
MAFDRGTGGSDYKTTCANGYNKDVAASASATILVEVEFSELVDVQVDAIATALLTGQTRDSSSASPPICGEDTKLEKGAVKFSVYSEFSGWFSHTHWHTHTHTP